MDSLGYGEYVKTLIVGALFDSEDDAWEGTTSWPKDYDGSVVFAPYDGDGRIVATAKRDGGVMLSTITVDMLNVFRATRCRSLDIVAIIGRDGSHDTRVSREGFGGMSAVKIATTHVYEWVV